jgi:enoyl-CoA hydratase/carnithine racemase
MSSDLVTSSLADGVLTLVWNRPERNNAWTFALENEYFDRLNAAAVDERVRAIVVTGEGRSFCPGLDSQNLKATSQAGADTQSEGRRPQTLPTGIPKPIIAAINGACAGIGLVQALMCDVRFAGRRARFSTAYSRRGLQAEHGIVSVLSRVVGFGAAMDLLLSARVFDAGEAAELGLVTVVDDDDLLVRATEYAGQLATLCSPRAMAAIKHQLYAPWGDELEAARQSALDIYRTRMIKHPDFAEGVSSFVEKRSPQFQPWTQSGWSDTGNP